MKKALLLSIIFILIAVPALAGWVQTDSDGSTTFLSDGKIKERTKGEPYYSVLDAQKGTILYVDTAKKRYAMDTIDNFCKSMVSEMEKAMQQIPKEQREEMARIMKKGNGKAPKVSVTKEGDGGTVAGYKTTKYRVLADGKLHEELWLSTDAALMKELGGFYTQVMKKFEKCMASVQAMGNMPISPSDSPEYKKLDQAGWELKSKTYSFGEAHTHEILKLERKSIPDSEFAVPAGYKKVPAMQVFMQE